MFRSTDYQHIVIDIGSSTIKIGFNGEIVPRVVMPNVVGTYKKGKEHLFKNRNFYGNEAIYNSSSLDLNYLRSDINGNIPKEESSLQKFESLLKYIFEKKLKVKSGNYNLFVINSLLTTSKEKYKLAQMFFEKFQIYNIHFEPQSLMTLYSTAKKSGIIIDSGEIMTEIVPIYEGYVIPLGIKTSMLAGKELTNQFLKKYENEFNYYNVNNKFEIAKNIKEIYSEILPSSDELIKMIKNNNLINNEYILPDDNKITINNEKYVIPESLFNPLLISSDSKSIPDLIFESINKCDFSIRNEFYNSIILSGGNTLIKNFPERLKSELELKIYNDNKKRGIENQIINKNFIKINASNERLYSSWIGASGLCSLGDFQDKWIGRCDYEELGEKLFEQNYLFNI